MDKIKNFKQNEKQIVIFQRVKIKTNTVYEINIMRFKNFIFLLGFF